MGNASLTERGSAGIEMVLWSLLFLIFVTMPFISGIFEIYHYAMKGIHWSAVTENVLDQLEWQIETQALSETRPELLINDLKWAFSETLDPVKSISQNEQWKIEQLTFVEGDPPRIEVTVLIRFEPATLVGEWISKEGLLSLRISRKREFPIDN